MVLAIDGFSRQTGQPAPAGPASYSRAIMESLAFKYRSVLESLEELTGRRFDAIRVVGGGARNKLLNQFTADATGRAVIAGPLEATALGNIAMQMLATGAVTSLGGGAAHHRPVVPGGAFYPTGDRSLGSALPAFSRIRGARVPDVAIPGRPDSCRSVGRGARRRNCRRSNNFATDRTGSAMTCASRTSAAATRARSSRCPIR